MAETFDAIVIGAGAMGSATTYHLARRNLSVLCLEQFNVPHAKGSSHGSSRKIRLTYHNPPEYVSLVSRAYELWEQLQSESGSRILYRNGGLYIGPRSCEFIDNLRAAATAHDLPVNELDRRTIEQEYSQFRVPEDYQVLRDDSSGTLRPERAVAAHLELAMRSGGQVRGLEPVIDWSASPNGVEVNTSRGTYSAGSLVICGGPWIPKIITDLGVELFVTRQVLAWVWPKTPERFGIETFPGWGLDDGNGRWFYGFPMLDGDLGLKLARDWKAERADPDTISREPTDADEEEIRPCLRRFLPDADGAILSMAICMYTNTPDDLLVVSRHPRHENVFLTCGSGHGFKFSAVIGEAFADLVETGATNLPIAPLGLDRFKSTVE
jgi:sarcosine oxidase